MNKRGVNFFYIMDSRCVWHPTPEAAGMQNTFPVTVVGAIHTNKYNAPVSKPRHSAHIIYSVACQHVSMSAAQMDVDRTGKVLPAGGSGRVSTGVTRLFVPRCILSRHQRSHTLALDFAYVCA